jgi:hypothetical protein
MKSIQFRLKKAKYILRVTGNSGSFHLSHANDYKKKQKRIDKKMGAYIELESNPLWPIFDKVIHLLNDLHLKHQTRVSQLN